MKNIVMIMVTTIMGVLTLMIVMTVEGRTNRSMELKSNLSSAAEETVEIMAVDEKYTIHDANEYIADFTENLAALLDSDSGIRVEVLNKDVDRDLLSIRVTEEFHHPNGNAGKVKWERTVFLNRLEEEKVETYTVHFYLGNQTTGSNTVYKICRVREGDTISVPGSPASTDGIFVGWVDANGYLADFTQPVMQDISYYGKWE